ncbi:MAG TPA: GIY-YIG nuclease family protein [Thermoanaerobaculia bacterium]
MRSGWKPDGERRLFATYIMSNTSMTLYTGVTNNLSRRVREHKTGEGSVFTGRYHFDRLVWFETTPDVTAAILLEKRIKGMSRKRKIALIKERSPRWIDLSAGWFVI